MRDKSALILGVDSPGTHFALRIGIEITEKTVDGKFLLPSEHASEVVMIALSHIGETDGKPSFCETAKAAPEFLTHHVIAAIEGDPKGPTLIVIGGLHGNEKGGVTAITNVARDLERVAEKIRGRVYFLSGNTRALKLGVRYLDTDLNRCWTAKNLSSSGTTEFRASSEAKEMGELLRRLDRILVTAEDEVYVIDLHSTSADGIPFATVGDTIRNRRFAMHFPLSILLGIEEQLDGTLLEYLNNAGAVTLGFEGGQHYSDKTVERHETLVRRALECTGILPKGTLTTDQPTGRPRPGSIFEVRYRHAITPADEFRMEPGFNNFDPISRGQILANDRSGPVKAVESGLILMPLYQKLGEDGFFIGRQIAAFWLSVSALLRSLGVQEWVAMLPGVRRDPHDREKLVVNTRVARLFPLQVFHLLGFRRRRWSGDKLIVSRRRHDTVSPFKREK